MQLGLKDTTDAARFKGYHEILIETTSSGMSDQLRDIYIICRYCWNVATYKWKVHNGKIVII
jgi:thymidine kinase